MKEKELFCGVVVVTFLIIFILNGVNGEKQTDVVGKKVRDDYCGESVTWTLSGGVLSIVGTGQMYDYNYTFTSPWYQQRSLISEVIIEEGVTSIGSFAFYGCALLKVEIPKTVGSIGESAFRMCVSLTQVLGSLEGVTSIGDYAFYQCSSLPRAQIPQSLSSLGNGVFGLCSSLSQVSFPSTISSIGNYSFQDCEKLTEVVFPQTVNSIGDSAFYGCSGLTQLVFPSMLSSLGSYAFCSCTGLTRVVIPTSVTSVGYGVFSSCTNLSSIEVEEGNMNFRSKGGVLFDYQYTTIVQYPPGLMNTSYLVPVSVNTLGGSCFFGSLNLNSVTIPSSVKVIEDGAFAYCHNLARVNIASGVTSIKSGAFCSCSSLTSVVIPSSVTSLGSSAFTSCSNLVDVVLSDSLQSIEGGVFSACSSLKHITIPSSVKSIQGGAFSSCSSLMNVTIMNGLEHILAGAFGGSNGLVHINFPDSLKTIESGAFYFATLTHITLPASIVSIGASAFSGSLSTVFYQGSKALSEYAFAGCAKIINVCVSPSYNSTQFCGLDVTSDNDICREFQNLFNDCSIPAYEDGHFIEQKRKNTTDWESHSNGCMEYKCVKGDGFVSWSRCNNSDKVNRMCVNNQCVDEDKIEKKVYVEIEMDKGVKVTEVNMSEMIETISALCKISSDQIEIGYELDSDGFILRIVVYVNNDETARVIANVLQSLNKGGNCKAVILCKSKAIRIVLSSQSISGVPHIEAFISIILLFVLLTQIY